MGHPSLQYQLMDVSKILHFLFHHLQSYYHILTILYEIFGQYNKENYQLILRHPAPCMPPSPQVKMDSVWAIT